MTRSVKKLAVLAVLGLLAAVAIPPLPATATHSGALTVEVGGHFGVGPKCDQETGEGCRGGESMRFQAPNLKVHTGDTLTFAFHGFHTATFLPEDADLFDWIQRNTPGTTSPFSLWVADPDDTALDGGGPDKPSTKVNRAVMFPTDPSCGAPDDPCSYDGSLLNSGFPEGGPGAPPSFSATVDANVGDVFWVLCLVHPHMFVKVTVVGNDVAATTQPEIDAAKTANLAADIEWAQAQDAKLINKQSSHRTATGQKVYDVYVGVDNHRTSLSAMYPRKTVVPKGSTVRFHFNELIYEHHTATMPLSVGLERGQEAFSPWCDPDTDSGPGPDEPAFPGSSPNDPGPSPEGPPCGGDLSKFEVDMPSPLWNVSGDGVFTGGRDFEHSGFRGGLQFSTGPFDVRFARASDKAWKFFCLVHGPFMSGRIKVR